MSPPLFVSAAYWFFAVLPESPPLLLPGVTVFLFHRHAQNPLCIVSGREQFHHRWAFDSVFIFVGLFLMDWACEGDETRTLSAQLTKKCTFQTENFVFCSKVLKAFEPKNHGFQFRCIPCKYKTLMTEKYTLQSLAST